MAAQLSRVTRTVEQLDPLLNIVTQNINDIKSQYYNIMMKAYLCAVDVEHVSAALDDGHEGDEDEGQQLQHGPNLPHLIIRLLELYT